MPDLITSINSAVNNVLEPNTITDYQGNKFEVAPLANLAGQVLQNFDLSKSGGGVFQTQGQSVGFDVNDVAQQLGRAPTVQEQVALDIARNLQQQGISDINQIKTGTYTEYQPLGESDGIDVTRTGLVGPSGQPITLGSTYTGPGGTAYNVSIDPTTGQPTFTTQGFDTSDRGIINAALLAAAAVGAPYVFGGGGSTLGGLVSTPAELASQFDALANLGAMEGAGLGGLSGTASGLGLDLTGGGGLAGETVGGAGVDFTLGGTTGLQAPKLTTTGLSTTGLGGGLPADYFGSNLATMGGGQGITGGVGANLATLGGGQGLSTTLGTGVNLTGGVGGAGPLMTAGGLVLPASGTLAGINPLTGLPLGSTVTGTDVVTGLGGLTTLGGLGNAGVTVGPGGTLMPTGGTATVLPGTTMPGTTTGTTVGTPGGTTAGTGGVVGAGTAGTGLGGLLSGLNTPIGLTGLLSGLGSLFSGALGAQAANRAAEIQAQTAREQMAQQKQLFDIINAQQAPYRQAGYGALSTIGSMLPGAQPVYDATGKQIGTQQGTGYLTQQYTPELFQQGMDPGYQFRLQQGQMAAQRAGNVAGSGLGGNVMRGLQDYTQGQASQEFTNAFNRFQSQRQNIYNTLAGIAGIGQTGQTASNQAAQQYGQNVANLATGAAGAQAAGQIGAAQGYGAGLGGLTNSLMLASLLGQNQNVAAQPAIG